MRLGMGLGLGNLLSGQPITGLPNKYSFNFDGSNDYLETADNESFDFGTGDFSISFWFNVSNIDWNWAVSRANSANNNDAFRAGTNDGGKIIFRDIGGGTDIVGSTTVSINTWYHYLAVRNSGTLKLYLNGSEDASGSSGGNFNSDKGFRVGRWFGSGDYFYGLIDEVAVWDTALSASDVAKIASKPVDFSKASTYATDRTSNLKLWLRAGDKAEPESTTAIARQDFYTDFDGTDDVVSISNTVAPTEAITVSAWVNFTSLQDYDLVVGNTDTGSNGWRLAMDNADNIIFAINSWGSNHAETPMSATGVWHHLVGTYDKTNIKIYLNGELKGTDAYTDSITYSSNVFQIGGASGWSNLTGSVSSVGVYQTALDAQTISQMAKSRFTPMRDNRFSVVDFDGSNDYINVSTTLHQSNTGTIVGWFNIDSTSGNQTFFSVGRDFEDTLSGDGIVRALYKDTSHNLKFVGYNADWDTTVDLVANTWYHLAVTWSGNNIVVYVNGVGYSNSSLSLNTPTGTRLKIGTATWTDSGNRFNGQSSSVSQYSTAKSAEEIYAIYQQGITYDESSLSGLVGYWRMGDDTSAVYPTIADSSSNSNDGTITNGASDDIVQQMVAGYDLGAFESSSEELGVELFPTSNSAYDVSTGVWSKDTASPPTLTYGDSSNGSASISASDITINTSKTYKITFTVSGLSSGTADITFNSALNEEYRAEESFTNGTFTRFFTTPSSHNGGFRFRSDTGSGSSFNVSDYSIKEVLQSEVSDSYPTIIDVTEPILGAELIENGEFDSDSDWTKGDGWTISSGVATSDPSAQSATSYLKSASFTALSTSKKYRLSYTVVRNAGTIDFIGFGGSDTGLTHRTASGTYFEDFVPSGANTQIWVVSGDGGFNGTIDNISLKELSGNVGTMTNFDNANSGDIMYGSVLPDQSFLTGVNSAYNFLDFDGTDAYVASGTSNIPSGDTSRSISVWLNADVLSGDQAIVYTGTRSTNQSFAIAFLSANANKISVWGTSNDFTGTTTISTGTWYHVVAVYDSSASNLKTYINGTLDIDTTVSTNFNTTIGNNIIGSGKFSGGAYTNFFNGKIAQPAIWNNRTLSSTEVSAIYTAGRHSNLLDSYSDNLVSYHAFGALDSKTGLADTDSTIYDRSGNSNHGTTSGTATGDLKSPPNATPNGYSSGDTNRSSTKP